MIKEIRKAIFPIAGLGTRFLPFSKAVSKELIPLVDKPMIHYAVEEALLSGIKKIEFVARPQQKDFLDYFARDIKLEKFLEENNKKAELDNLKEVEAYFKNIDFSIEVQKNPQGNAHAIFQSRNFIKNEPCGVFFCDDVIKSEQPGFQQLTEVFKTCGGRPVLALKTMPDDKLSSYGVVQVEKIANSFYKIKRVAEKPKSGTAPSNLAVLGRMILTPDVFEYMEANKSGLDKDLSIVPLLGKMAEEGKAIYGYEIKGEWLECGNKMLWLKSFVSLLLDDPRFGGEIRKYLNELNIQ
ncbi:MAG: sugar phosphate nucleotidyltransferase [Candidatus Pacebacteria bacterium]|nr:sugar phosphate nucleotidyltransferase [Candidatus Paceibacterota bacterium]